MKALQLLVITAVLSISTLSLASDSFQGFEAVSGSECSVEIDLDFPSQGSVLKINGNNNLYIAAFSEYNENVCGFNLLEEGNVTTYRKLDWMTSGSYVDYILTHNNDGSLANVKVVKGKESMSRLIACGNMKYRKTRTVIDCNL